jgi:hypothetical protein
MEPSIHLHRLLPPNRTSLSRAIGFLAALVAAVLITVTVAPADAHAAGAGTQISPGWFVLGATVTGPGTAAPRTMNESQAAAFVQAWLPAQLSGQLKQQDPPRSPPMFTVHVDDTINGAPEHLIAYYVSDGQSAWVSMPIQDLGGGAVVNKRAWFLAPPRTIAAFEGRLAPAPTAGSATTAPISGTAAPKPATSKPGSSNAPLWIALGVAALVGLAVFGVARTRRSPSRS